MHERLPSRLLAAAKRVQGTGRKLETGQSNHTAACEYARELAELPDGQWFCHEVTDDTLQLTEPGSARVYSVPARAGQMVLGSLDFPDTPRTPHIAELMAYTPNHSPRRITPILPRTRRVCVALFQVTKQELTIVNTAEAADLVDQELVLHPHDLAISLTIAAFFHDPNNFARTV